MTAVVTCNRLPSAATVYRGKRIFIHTVNDIHSWGHLKISRRRLRTYKQFGEIVVDARHAEVRFALEWLSHIVDSAGSKR